MERHESTSHTPGRQACFRSMILTFVACVWASLAPSAWAGYANVAGPGALEFDGVDDYVNLGNTSSLQLTGDMAVSAWCKTAEGSAGLDVGIAGKMVSHGGTSCSGFLLFRWLGHIWFLSGPGGRYEAIGTDWAYNDSEWHHVAGTIRGGDAYLYVDGVLAENLPQICAIDDSGEFAFVGRECSNVEAYFFQGLIDDVRFYSRGLAGTEIAGVMSQRPSVPEVGLVGYWAFDESSGQSVYDTSGWGNHGLRGGTDNTEPSDPKRVLDTSLCGQRWTSALSFDTYSQYSSAVTNNNYDHVYVGGHLPVGRIAVGGTHQSVLSMFNPREVGTNYVVAAEVALACGAPAIPLNRMSVSFDYRFDTAGEPAAKGLLVNLRVGDRLVRLDGVAAPLPTSPGGSNQGSWRSYVDEPVVYANAGEPLAIELTLKGCEGTAVQIDNLTIAGLFSCGPDISISVSTTTTFFSPPVRCIMNACDLAGVEGLGLGPEDFYAAVVSCGASTTGVNSWCLDQTFTSDGFASMDDALYWSWACKESAPFTCGGGIMSLASTASTSPAAQGTVAGCAVSGPWAVAGKAYFCDRDLMDQCIMSDRIFSLNASGAITGQPATCADDGYCGRLVADAAGNLYQVHLTKGLVSVATGQSILAPRALRLGNTNTMVYVGWNGVSGAPPIQDAAFDSSGDVYVVPVVVCPTNGSSYRAAARIRPGDAPQVIQLYTTPLFATGAYEIETDNSGNVYVLDKRHWDDSRLLRYQRNSSQLQDSVELETAASVGTPTAFYVSPGGRIWVADQTWDTMSHHCYLVELRSDYSPAKRVEITPMGYLTGICEHPSTGDIWTVGFRTWFIRTDVLNGIASTEPPRYGPYIARVRSSDSGSVPATFLLPSGYQETENEQLSLPLSIVWKGY